MNGSRRTFLGKGCKVGLGVLLSGGLRFAAFGQKPSSGGVGAGPSALVPNAALGDPLFQITSAMFSGNLNSRFAFKLGGVKLTDMTLVAVDDQTPAYLRNSGSTRECFSLVFQGPRSLPLRQETYTVDHNKLGTFRLFIVPGDTNNSGSAIRYGALINRVYP